MEDKKYMYIYIYIPLEGSPRVVHVLFPVSTPVSRSTLAFKTKKKKEHGMRIRLIVCVFSAVSVTSSLYLVDIVKEQKAIGLL